MADNFNISDQGGGAGASNFLALTDTPGSYAASALDLVRVNAGTSALEFSPGGSGAFSKTETILTSGNVSITAVAFADIAGAVSPSFTPGAGEVVVVYTVMSVEAPAGGDRLQLDILHDNSGAFVSIFGTTEGMIEVERDDHSTCFAFPVTMPAAVATVFKMQGRVDAAGTGTLKADAAEQPFVMGVLRT